MNTLLYTITVVYCVSIIYLGLDTLNANCGLDKYITYCSKFIKKNYHIILCLIALLILSPLIALHKITKVCIKSVKWLGEEV